MQLCTDALIRMALFAYAAQRPFPKLNVAAPIRIDAVQRHVGICGATGSR